MKPRNPVQAARRQYRQMLQIALTPAPVARGKIQQRWRAFLVAAAQRRRHMDSPTATTHERSLNEIMAEDVPAERLAATQFRKGGVLGKSFDTDDGVMPPVVAFGSMPPGNASGNQRAVQPSGKLLPPCEQRSGVHHNRQRLDQRDVPMSLHGSDKSDDGVSRHQAVSIQNNHTFIVRAEPLDPILDIAGFARGVFRTVTIEKSGCRTG